MHKIQSIEMNGKVFRVGRCLPGDIFSPIIHEIKDESAEFPEINVIVHRFNLYDKKGFLIARITELPKIIIFEPRQKEAPECAKL